MGPFFMRGGGFWRAKDWRLFTTVSASRAYGAARRALLRKL